MDKISAELERLESRRRKRVIGLFVVVSPLFIVIFGLIVPALFGPAIGQVFSNVVMAL